MPSTTRRTLSPKIVGVHVTDDAEEAAHLQEQWEKWGEGVNLVILESPYRSLMGPLLVVHRHGAEETTEGDDHGFGAGSTSQRTGGSRFCIRRPRYG